MLAVSLGTLSMIDPTRLDTASDALSKVMAMFALMIASTSIAKKANSTIGVMVLVVGALAGMLALMSELPAAETKIIADALSELLLSLSASLLLLNGVKTDAKKALSTTSVMVLIIGALGGI